MRKSSCSPLSPWLLQIDNGFPFDAFAALSCSGQALTRAVARVWNNIGLGRLRSQSAVASNAASFLFSGFLLTLALVTRITDRTTITLPIRMKRSTRS
jgi:hypothetical protein